MKPIRLITPMLAIAAVVVISSCSAPRLAQKSSGNDDVYNSVAKAQEYVQPDPSQMAQYQDDQNYDDNYGTSDPNYDMDYSSRINRFYYGTPYRNYYDPYYGDFYSGLSPYSTGWSMGFGWGFGNYYNSIWNNPYYYGGWGGFYSPYYAYNPWGWGGGYYGGGWGGWGGGYWGGGWGGGYYGNRLPGNTTYGARPYRGSENGVGRPSRVISNGSYNGRGSTVTRNGVTYSDRSSRPQNYVPNRVNRGSADMGNRPSNPYVSPRPSRSDNYTPQRESRPSYTPPSNSGGGGYQGGGGGGGGSRSQRGGRN